MDDEGKAGEHLSNLFRYLRTKMILWVIAFIFPILLLLSVSLRWITNSYERQMNVNFSQSLVQYSADIDAASGDTGGGSRAHREPCHPASN